MIIESSNAAEDEELYRKFRARENILSCFVLIFSLFLQGEIDSSYHCYEKRRVFFVFRIIASYNSKILAACYDI